MRQLVDNGASRAGHRRTAHEYHTCSRIEKTAGFEIGIVEVSADQLGCSGFIFHSLPDSFLGHREDLAFMAQLQERSRVSLLRIPGEQETDPRAVHLAEGRANGLDHGPDVEALFALFGRRLNQALGCFRRQSSACSSGKIFQVGCCCDELYSPEERCQILKGPGRGIETEAGS